MRTIVTRQPSTSGGSVMKRAIKYQSLFVAAALVTASLTLAFAGDEKPKAQQAGAKRKAQQAGAKNTAQPASKAPGVVAKSKSQRGPAKRKAAQGGAYHVAAGKTYNMQAHDHARMLRKYADVGDEVPGDVVQDHAAAIRFNTEGAKKSYDRLAKSEPGNAALAKIVEQLRKRLDMVTAELELLEAQEAESAAESKMISARTNEISKHLQANHRALRAIDNDFYDSSSDSYYETGEGHFVD
ncbi:MAG TPA: hypothetical protein VND64_07965 [Pirellulales bacterium]|nr:hypothetical protein [Pirellulales bacterium]